MKMKIRTIAFFLVFLVLMATVGLVEEVWLTRLPVKNSEVFPPWITSLDSATFILINQSLSNPLLDLVMSLITHVGSTIFWLIIASVIWLNGRKKEAVLLGTAIILGGVFSLFLKVLISRPRPYQVIAGSRVFDIEAGSSFPSGHAGNVFSASIILGKGRGRKWQASLYMLAAVVSFSRIYVGMHYPLDVLVGALGGYIAARITLLYEKQITSLVTKFTT